MPTRSSHTRAHPGVPPARLLPICLFISGAGSLVLEIAWSRALSLSLGNSYQAVATVVASMMAGLCLGSLTAARFLPRLGDPARGYARVELGIGFYSLLTPLLFAGLPLLLAPLYSLPAIVFALIRFAIVFLLLMPASAGMGATLPLATAALAPAQADEAGSGSTGGRLYGWNTLGAFTGTLTAGFALLPLLGLFKTTLIGSFAGLCAGALVLSLYRAGTPVPSGPAVPLSPTPESRADFWVLPLYAASGAVALIYEITWTRVLAPLAGTSVFAFSLILAALLAGIGGGSLLLSGRRLSRDPARAFAAGQILLSVSAFLSLWGLAYFPELLLGLAQRQNEGTGPGWLLFQEFLLFALIVLPPGMILGGLFPFAARLMERRASQAGSGVGRAYAWNTAGSLAGSLAAGFFLVERFGSEKTLAGACVASAVLGALSALLLPPGRIRAWTMGAGIAAAAVIPWMVPTWDIYRMTTGITQLLRQASRAIGRGGPSLNELRHPASVEVVFHREGKTSTVTVVKEKGQTFLRVDGKVDASTLAPDMLTQALMGHLPFFFARDPKDVFVLGYGSGVTTGSVLTHPVRSVDTVEIEAEVIAASPLFEAVNRRPLQDPRHHLFVEDARTVLSYGGKDYDIIISEPSNPWMAGVNNLFTREFYALARQHLRGGGVFCQWVQAYEMSNRSVHTILDTLAASFPHAQLFASQLGTDMILLASEEPLRLVPGAAELFPDRQEVASDLARVGVKNLPDLALRYTAPLPAPPPRTLLNTDDNSLIQYRAPFDALRLRFVGDAPRRNTPSPEAMMNLFFPGRTDAEVFPVLARSAQRIGAKATVESIAEYLEQQGLKAEAQQVRAMASNAIGVGTAATAAYILVLAEERIRLGDGFGAMDALKQAEAKGLEGADQLSRSGYVWLKVRRYAEAEKQLDQAAADSASPVHYRALAGRGAARLHLGRREEGLKDIAAAKSISPQDPLAYLLLGLAYKDVGDPAAARRELQAGLKVAPNDPRLVHALDGLK